MRVCGGPLYDIISSFVGVFLFVLHISAYCLDDVFPGNATYPGYARQKFSKIKKRLNLLFN